MTRDRIYFDAEWLNREFTMIDTGGIEFITDNSHVIPKMMRLQAELAIEEADVILFVVDGNKVLYLLMKRSQIFLELVENLLYS